MLFAKNKHNNNRPVLILAGGTGGHVYPGLAVATELLAMKIPVAWLGNNSVVEQKTVKNHKNINYFSIKMQGVRGKQFVQKLLLLVGLIPVFVKTLCLLLSIRPRCVLSMGGFVSGPAGIMAKIIGLRLVIHEQNSIPGFTNKILSKFAHKIFTGFPACFNHLAKAQFSGNPVRKEFVNIDHKPSVAKPKSNKLRLLALGGSQGAKKINQTLVSALTAFDKEQYPDVWHQTGDSHFLETKRQYEMHDLPGKVVPYIENMIDAYRWADIVLCRSGAMTISELTCVGVGAILIPYPYAVDNHQVKNADYLVQNAAGVMIEEARLTPDLLKDTLLDFAANPQSIASMAKKSFELAKTDAVNIVARACV